jgi:GGDEF domain-containing protein
MRERIEKSISTFLLPVNEDTYAAVGISVGSATFGVDGETLDQLLITADQAMYSSKAEHKQNRRLATVGHGEGLSDMHQGKLASTAIN